METIKVKIKKLHKDAVIPKYAYKNDAGADVVAIDYVETDKYIEYFTGIAMEFDPNFVCCLFPRSSITKKDLMLKNSVGVGDPDYRNGYTFRFWKTKENGPSGGLPYIFKHEADKSTKSKLTHLFKGRHSTIHKVVTTWSRTDGTTTITNRIIKNWNSKGKR